MAVGLLMLGKFSKCITTNSYPSLSEGTLIKCLASSRVIVFEGPGILGYGDTRAFEDYDPACVGFVRVL